MDKLLTKYDISIGGLEEKSYRFDFEGNNDFFKAFDQDMIDKGEFKATVTLEKNSRLIRAIFDIEGKITLECDRCLEEFEEPLKINETYIYKFGESVEEMSDEMEVIPFGTVKINVAELIYDYIYLTIPMKKVHPKFRNAEIGDELVYIDPNFKNEEKTEDIDPRWADLLKIKENKFNNFN